MFGDWLLTHFESVTKTFFFCFHMLLLIVFHPSLSSFFLNILMCRCRCRFSWLWFAFHVVCKWCLLCIDSNYNVCTITAIYSNEKKKRKTKKIEIETAIEEWSHISHTTAFTVSPHFRRLACVKSYFCTYVSLDFDYVFYLSTLEKLIADKTKTL